MAGRTIRAPRGTERSCRGWVQEAALRMLMNNLDPEVAERPEDLVVYGGTGKAARDWASLRPDRRQRSAGAGRRRDAAGPVGQAGGRPAHPPDAPRVLIANSNLVGRWATWEHFRELESEGPDDVRPDDRRLVDLHRHAGHPAGHLRDLRPGRAAPTSAATISRGRLVLSGGLGGMGGAQPLAATMNGAVFLGVEVDPERARRRVEHALPGRGRARPRRRAGARWTRPGPSAGAVHRGHRQRGRRVPGAGAARRRARPGDRPDLRARSAERLRPRGLSLAEAAELRRRDPEELRARAPRSRWPSQVRAMLDLRKARAATSSTTATTSAPAPQRGGAEERVRLPRLRPGLHPAAVLRGPGARSAGWRCPAIPRTSAAPTARCWSCSRRRAGLRALDHAWRSERVAFQGLPARICWLGYGERRQGRACASTSWCAGAR